VTVSLQVIELHRPHACTLCKYGACAHVHTPHTCKQDCGIVNSVSESSAVQVRQVCIFEEPDPSIRLRMTCLQDFLLAIVSSSPSEDYPGSMRVSFTNAPLCYPCSNATLCGRVRHDRCCEALETCMRRCEVTLYVTIALLAVSSCSPSQPARSCSDCTPCDSARLGPQDWPGHHQWTICT
jgi:hypothetical protein